MGEMASQDDHSEIPLTEKLSGEIRDTSVKPDHVDEQHAPPPYEGSSSRAFDDVVNSDIGISTLLNRLKQSIASARDFSAFLRKRSSLEDEHAQDLKKLCRTTHEGIRRPEHRQGSYAQNFDELTRIQERMADHGLQFAQSLHQMHDELTEVTANSERGRKHWKQVGMSAEKRMQDAETSMEKAKAKYDSLAEDYDRARTGDRQSGKKFGLKGPRSAAQLEEDLQRKVQAADSDYASKVQTANGQRQELRTYVRPQAVKALQDLIRECDSALTMQMQKYALLNETYLLNNGTSISPMAPQADGQGGPQKSLREIVSQIDNDKDLHTYVMSFASKVVSKPLETKYERHPSLAAHQQTPPSANRPPQAPGLQQAPPSFPVQMSNRSQPPRFPQPQGQASQPFQQPPSTLNDQGPPMGSQPPLEIDTGVHGPPQHLPPPLLTESPQLPPTQYGIVPHQQSTPPPSNGTPFPADLAPLKPVFGHTLEELYRRDGSAVPIIVYQCLQAVDLYGLEVEGIYRLSGTASHVARIKAMFDHDSLLVDFRNPEHFLHDVNSVAGALKQFFRELPDPLLTREHYAAFIEASRIDDDIVRRDSLHAVINNLPDPNYATLRALILHLYRVQERSPVNRMNSGNLAICFGPTLMGSNTGPNIADAGWQARVIDTILQNTYQIFDDD